MNSFAALMGSLTGAGISATAGTGASGASGDGLFAGLLEASIAANPLNGKIAGAGLEAALAGKDGASAPGTIDLATLLQATTDADGNIILTDIPVEGALPIPPVRFAGDEGSELSLPSDTEKDPTEPSDVLPGVEGEVIAAQQPADAPGAAGEDATGPATQVGASGDTGQPGAVPPQDATPTAAPAEAALRPTGRDTAPGQEHAAANRPEHAQRNAASAPGLNGAAQKPAPTLPTAQAAATAPQPSPGADAANTADSQEAAKAAHLAANTKTAEDTSKTPAVLPAEGETRSRADLARPVEIARTTAVAPNGQTVLQVIKSGKVDASSAAGIDQGAASSVHVRSAAVQLQPATQQPQVPLNGMAVHIAQQAANGARRFDIRLDPPELGRVEVRLDVSHDGKVSTHLVVERSETLDLLQRDARALERALQNAGLDTADGGMKFSLKDQGDHQAHSGSGRQSHGRTETGGGEDTSPSPAEIDNATRAGRRYLATGGLDVRI